MKNINRLIAVVLSLVFVLGFSVFAETKAISNDFKDGAAYTLYLDGKEVVFTEDPKYGKANIYGETLMIGQNIEHYALTTIGVTGLHLLGDQVRMTAGLLDPDDFLEGEDAEYLPSKELPTATANVTDNFDDGDYSGWTVNSTSLWEVVDGVLIQNAYTPEAGVFGHWAMMDEGDIAGDFTLSGDIGGIDKGLDMPSETEINWTIYYRNFGFGIMQDENNYLIARNMRSRGYGVGLGKAINGSYSQIYSLYPSETGNGSQGVGYDVHDLMNWKVSRSGETITCWIGGKVLWQASDTSSTTKIDAGWAVFGNGGHFGLAVDNVILSSSAPDPPTWTGPDAKTDFTFWLNEGNGSMITDESGAYWGLVEGGSNTTTGSKFGWWAEDGVVEGNKSFALNFGQMGIYNVTLSSQFTLEATIKMMRPVVPIFYPMLWGTGINENFGNCLRGGLISSGEEGAEAADLILSWDDAGTIIESMPKALPIGEWVHVAWVRDGTANTVYVGGKGVAFGEDALHDDVVLTNAYLVIGQAADHDWVLAFGEEPYFYIDQIRLTSAVVDPKDFMMGQADGEGPTPVVGPACDFNGDGKILINDVIDYLLYARDNPNDLEKLDWNGDGKYLINDSIIYLLKVQNGTCPDALIQLSGIADEILVVKMEGLTQEDIEYIEEIMTSMSLTEEQESAFRVALYGRAGATTLPNLNTLSQNSPNPFNPSTTISFTVVEGSAVHVSLKVYDLRGNLVRTLVNEVHGAGTYNVFWDGTDNLGRSVASGVYLYRMQAGNFSQTRKMVLMK